MERAWERSANEAQRSLKSFAEDLSKLAGKISAISDRLKPPQALPLLPEGVKFRTMTLPAADPSVKELFSKPIVFEKDALRKGLARDKFHVSYDNGDSNITGPEQRILDAIAWCNSIGIEEPNQTAVCFLAKYTWGGGGFNNPRGSLHTKGLVQYLGDRIRLTEEGRQLAHTPTESLDAQELQQRVLGILPTPEQRLLKPLLEAYPEPLTNEELAEATGYALGSGGLNNPRGRLRTLGLIDYPSSGLAVASSLLFLE